MPSSAVSSFHRSDVNWAPLSDAMSVGVPNRAIQCLIRALAHVSVLESGIGIASGQWVNRSTTVKK